MARSHSSLTRASEKLEVVPVAQCSKTAQVDKAQEEHEVSREWAEMVKSGGVTVKPGVLYFFKDRKGIKHFVSPPTGSRPRGRILEQRLGSLALSAVKESSPSGDVAPEVEKATSSQPQRSEGGEPSTVKVVKPVVGIASPTSRVSPRERSVSPRRSLKRTHGGGRRALGVRPGDRGWWSRLTLLCRLA